MKHFKRFIKIFLTIAIMGLFYSFFFSVYENIKINKTIENFKNRASDTPTKELLITVDSETKYIRRYFEVPRETQAELNDPYSVFYNGNIEKFGNTGDIFVTLDSPFYDSPFIHKAVSFYFGGHAALVNYQNDQPTYIEAFGFPSSGETIIDYITSDGKPGHGLTNYVSVTHGNYWFVPNKQVRRYYDMFYRDKFIGLRAVNPFKDEENGAELYKRYTETAVERALEKADNEAIYNFLFFLNTRNKYYCSDLMSRVYTEAYEAVVKNKEEYRSKGYAKKINDDGFITSVQDLVLSKDTFITFYVEINKDLVNDELMLVENIYYLADLEA